MARTVGLGIIGGGLMGRELASAAARWVHLLDFPATPQIAAVCDVDPAVLDWYADLIPQPSLYSSYRELLENQAVEVVYCALPHNLHEEVCVAALRAGKHLLGEKPLGIDRAANLAIVREAAAHPQLMACCSSEFPFYPGGQAIAQWIREQRFGRVLGVRAAFLHSSDLDPLKPINWKRQTASNGEYGCMGDLGMHALHMPLRAGWLAADVRAILSDVVDSRPDAGGIPVRCDTWDNATLLCRVRHEDGYSFPMQIETQRIAPGEMNTWSLQIDGSAESIAYSTKRPKTLRHLIYRQGTPQSWSETDLGSQSAYPTITGGIFEFGFSDAILQMWAAFLDELIHGVEGMRQPFRCATVAEAMQSHAVLHAALESHRANKVAAVAVGGSNE